MTPTSISTPDPNEFDGKRVLVTGGTKGAGKAIAERFQQGGATVIITARSAPEKRTGNHFIQADVSTAEGTTKVINEILNRFQAVDVIIHNVGGSSAPAGGFVTVTDRTRLPSLWLFSHRIGPQPLPVANTSLMAEPFRRSNDESTQKFG